MGAEVVIEEAFVDVFCDLVYGGGWMDIEREDVDRECNWALVSIAVVWLTPRRPKYIPPQIEFKALPLSRSTISGGTDPRTSTTVFLFEEFVPLEYRQQLSAGVQNKRTLSSFFSPGKTKQWKQATTLNGRPYVVGHVPRGLNSREVEFEGLLRGNNNSTKLISLGHDGPVKRDVSFSEAMSSSRPTMPLSGPPPSSMLTPVASRTPRQEDISSPLFAAVRGEHGGATLRPSTPTTGAGGTPATKRRFRLPSTLTPNSRTSGLTPSVAEDIDFETRLASYSDDELNSLNTSNMRKKQSKHERRRSKDDAWVDILVASHSRRATNQDADIIRRPQQQPPSSRSRDRDPEMASQEVAQVLAGVVLRAHSPPPPPPHLQFDGNSSSEADIEPMQVPHRSKMNYRGTTPLDDSYEPTIPESEVHEEEEEEHPEDDDEVVLSPSSMARRRLGYFDLHPERRPAPLHLDDDDDEGLHELNIRAPIENDVEPPRRSDVTTESVYSSGAGHSPPSSPKPKLEISTPTMTTALRPRSPLPPPTTTPSPQTPTPQTPTQQATTTTLSPRDLQRQQEVRDRLSGKPGPKASSLIEMYRERERQASGGGASGNATISPGTVRRLSQQAKESMALPALPEPEPEPPAVSSSSSSSSPGPAAQPQPEVEVEVEEDILEPPVLDLDQGRNSPFRYVHGAPLHNVVEEEEEE